jgi:uncharacterized protein with PQ loop repeat
MCVCVTSSYVYFCRAQSDVKYLVGGTIVVGITMGVFVATDDPEIVGYGAAAFNLILFWSPLAAMSEVKRMKSVEKMPLLPIVMAFVASASWIVYGTYILKFQIMITNICGFLLSTMQLVVYRRYSRVTVTDAEDSNSGDGVPDEAGLQIQPVGRAQSLDRDSL